MKSYTDFISWVVGLGLWDWATWRFYWVFKDLLAKEDELEEKEAA